jgi:hypothetical protein
MSRTEQRLEWEKRIEEFKASGLSAAAWCKMQDLKPHRFNYYLCKDKPLKPSTPPTTRWLSVEIENSEVAPDQMPALLVKVGEATIEVKSGFDPTLLCQLVRTLSIC